MIVMGGLESSSLRVSVFREISASGQRGCGEGIDCGCVERFLPNWVIKVKRDDRELPLVIHVRGRITGKPGRPLFSQRNLITGY